MISVPDGASGAPESYMIDAYDGPGGSLRRKSFEHGTSLDAKAVDEGFRADVEHWLAKLASGAVKGEGE
jgi:hypothetical protein